MQQTNKKRRGYLISALLLLTLVLITLFAIFLFVHPDVYFSKASGFSQHDGVRAGKNKLRFVVPETIDTTKFTYISVKQEWFETSRMGKITDIKAKPGKHLALDFTDREYNSEVFTIYTKNWFGIKREHDVIVDYSNFLRIFFPEPNAGEAPRKPIILPYSKLKTEYKHVYEELLKINSFSAFDEKGLVSGQYASKDEVFNKENARGRAFIVNNSTHVSLVYDFLLPGIFKNQSQKTQVIDYIEKSAGKFKTYDPAKQGIDIKFNTAPFYISKFLGWYYIDPTGNRVDLKPGEEVSIPNWVMSELRLIARYDITTDTDKIGPELDKQGLVAVSYFDGAQRVIFDIVKKGTPLKEHIYQKEGYAYAGWYKDSALTEKVDFTKELATTHTVLYLKSIKQNQPQPEKPVQHHTINFITPSDANQLFPTRRAHGQKLETNYLTPSLVSRLDANGNLEELDYWNLVDPVTGVRTRFNFDTPITEDITLEAVMRKRVVPNSKYTIKRYFESVDQAGNFVEDKSKEEVVEGQTPGTEVELSPTQTNAPTGFTLASGTVVKKKINKDGTTVFELRYTRNRYTVDFEVNYNGNHFKGVNSSTTPSQTVAYEGKLTKPANPTITKAGYTYVFKHWQLKDEMGNVYKEVSKFDFVNTKITKNLTLVAYFEEKKDVATYTVKHIFQGISGQIDERVEEKKFTEQVGKSITVSQENRDKNYDEHFEVADFTDTKKVEADGSTVFEIRYARKKYRVNFEVNYNGNHFKDVNASSTPEQTVPFEGKLTKPANPTITKSGYTYTFKHWQLKDEMGNVYKEVSEFDFNTKITKNLTLVAYFEENAQTVTYTIKHVFEGIDDITQREEIVTKSAKTNSQVTVSSSDKLSGYDHGFEIKTTAQTQTVKADGSTTFTLNYTRREFEVTYNVNFQNKLEGQVSPNPATQKVKYEGKVKMPSTPYVAKHGRTYQFIHWQTEASMNGVYSQQFAYNFSSRVTENLSLVAYFTETRHTVNYKIIHKLEKQGPDSSLNGTYDDIIEEQKNQLVENGATYKPYNKLDNTLYEKDNKKQNTLYQILNVGNNSTVVLQHYKLKEITVEYKKTAGIKSLEYEQKNVKKTRKIPLPTYTLMNTHNFSGWSLYQTGGTTQTDFIAGNTNITIYAQTDFQYRKIAYIVKTQKLDGKYVEKTEIKSQKIGTVHTVNYPNPDNTVYERPTSDRQTFFVNPDENKNRVVVTIKRKTYTVTYQVIGHSSTIPSKVFRHSQIHGEIDESKYEADGLEIKKLELDGKQKTKAEIMNLEVKNNHKIRVYVGELIRKVGKYPQTKVDNPEGIKYSFESEKEIPFNSKGKNYTIKFTRYYYIDKYNNRYEKYNGQYYKFEDIEFVKFPKQKTWFTKKIIDFSPFNIFYEDYPNNAKPVNSILKSITAMIGAYINQGTFMPTFDDGEFSVKPAFRANMSNKLMKEPTDYAKAIFGNYDRYQPIYRGINFNAFFEPKHLMLYYDGIRNRAWWLATQYILVDPHTNFVTNYGDIEFGGVSNVFGVVVCIR